MLYADGAHRSLMLDNTGDHAAGHMPGHAYYEESGLLPASYLTPLPSLSHTLLPSLSP